MQFVTGNREVLEGLEMAVMSMKRKEESQFIIPYQLLYGELGCGERIPKQADSLFVIHLLDFVAIGDDKATENVPTEDRSKYSVMIDKILEVDISGKDHFRNKAYSKAAKSFHSAINSLEMCRLANENEEKERNEHLIRLYVNSMTCYNRMDLPTKVCSTYADLSRLTDTAKHPKALFHYGKALIALGEFKRAKDALMKASRLKPHDSEIVEQLTQLNIKYGNHKKTETNLWQKAFGNEQCVSDAEPIDVTDKFKERVNESIMKFKNDTKESKMSLPDMLTNDEKAYIRDCIKDLPMKMVTNEIQGVKSCHLAKIRT